MRHREFLNVTCTLSLITGIILEQIIHLPGEGYRFLFGSLIGNYFGSFTVGATMAVATLAGYLIPSSFGANETIAKRTSAIIGGIAIGFLTSNEVLGIGPGSPALLDIVAPLAAFVSVAGFGELCLLGIQNRT